MAKILIAEDDLGTRKIAVRVVEKLGHVAIQACNGRRAWEILQDNLDVELLLTDVMMPEMDGIELIDILRDDPGFKELPVIIMSAYVGVNDIASYLDHGATVFLPKPLRRDALAGYLGEHLRN